MLLEQEHKLKKISLKKIFPGKKLEFLVPLGVNVHLLLHMGFFSMW